MNTLTNCPVLVTGGAGFIGSHLVEKLIAIGAHVTVLDNLSTGLRTNLTAVIDRITFIEGDITDYATCLLATKGTAIIFHLAAIASVPACAHSPLSGHCCNVTGTLNLLEAARSNKVNRFIFSSSSAVYGNQITTCSESTPCKPTSWYGYTKLMGEQYCQLYAQISSLSTVSLRYFNVYGARQRADVPFAGAVATFRECMKRNETLVIEGDGLQQRDFVPVEFVVQANINFATTATTFAGDRFNIATGHSISLLHLINQLKKEFPHYQAPLQFVPARSGDIRYSAALCTKYHTFLASQSPYLSFPFCDILSFKEHNLT